jgi:hypothetical protein
MADSNSSNNESNPVSEEKDTWKISGSTDIGPDNCMNAKLTRQLHEHCALKKAVNIFPRHHPAYNSLFARAGSLNMPSGLKLIQQPSQWLKLDFSTTVS